MTLSRRRKIHLGMNRLWNSSLQNLSLQRQRVFNKPIDISFDITYRCCLRCRMCDIWQSSNNKKRELSVVEWKEILCDLHRWLGPFYAQFSGGEPFMKEGLLEILRLSHKLGNYNKIVTNAFLLDRDLCDDIMKSEVDSLNVSLDSLNPELHDYVRGKKGVYQRAKTALGYLSKHRNYMHLSISTIILKQNLEELLSIVRWAEEMKLDFVVFQPLEENFQAKTHHSNWYKRSEFWIDDLELLNNTLDELITLKSQGAPIWNSVTQLNAIRDYYRAPEELKGNSPCNVGYKNLSINAFGEVRFCFLMKPVGNYFDYSSTHQMWVSKEAENSRKAILRCKRKCLLNCHQSQSLIEKLKSRMMKK